MEVIRFDPKSDFFFDFCLEGTLAGKKLESCDRSISNDEFAAIIKTLTYSWTPIYWSETPVQIGTRKKNIRDIIVRWRNLFRYSCPDYVKCQHSKNKPSLFSIWVMFNAAKLYQDNEHWGLDPALEGEYQIGGMVSYPYTIDKLKEEIFDYVDRKTSNGKTECNNPGVAKGSYYIEVSAAV